MGGSEVTDSEALKTLASYAECTLFDFSNFGHSSCGKATKRQFELMRQKEWCEVCELKKKLKMYPFYKEESK